MTHFVIETNGIRYIPIAAVEAAYKAGTVDQLLAVANSNPLIVEAAAAQYRVHSAAAYLNQALQLLASNPDLTEKKRQLAHLLKMLVPDASKLNTYEDAFELAESIAAAESGAKKNAFEDIKNGLMAAFKGARQLQTAMVRSPKLLPKI